MVENQTFSQGKGRLLAPRRRELILREIERNGGARVRELVDLLGVSPMTIRRDIEILADAGMVLRVHGGAALNPNSGSASSEEPSFDAKSRRQFVEKTSIAAVARGLIKSGSAIGITAGTTTAQLSTLLDDFEDLLIVTNSVAVADLLPGKQRNITLLVTGGMRTPSNALVGPVAESTLENLHLDQLFLGVHGMSESAGYTSPNLLEAQTLRSFAAAAESVVVLADHTKWDTVGLSSIGPLGLADIVVTDSSLDPSNRRVLESHVGRLVLAGGE